MKGLLMLLVLVGILGGGYYYYLQYKSSIDGVISNTTNVKNTIVTTTTTDIDAAIQAAMKSVNPISLLYYANNRNYGVSEAENICNDTSSNDNIGTIIADIQTYTKSISCVVDPNFPSKSFTLVAPSFANEGQYYCTDQNGTVILIPSVSQTSTFKAGLSCR